MRVLWRFCVVGALALATVVIVAGWPLNVEAWPICLSGPDVGLPHGTETEFPFIAQNIGINNMVKDDTLPDSDGAQDAGNKNKPFCKRCDLARIFSDLPIGVYFLIAIVSCILWAIGFNSLLFGDRVVIGVALISAAFVLWFSDGFAATGNDPLGWIAWIRGY